MILFDPNKRFYKGNLHTHTTNSDGRRSPEDVLATYRAEGYDFIALTDHWKKTTGETHDWEGMLVLPGIELDYTLPAQVIHIVGIGVDESVLNASRSGGAQSGIDAIRNADGRSSRIRPGR